MLEVTKHLTEEAVLASKLRNAIQIGEDGYIVVSNKQLSALLQAKLAMGPSNNTATSLVIKR